MKNSCEKVIDVIKSKQKYKRCRPILSQSVKDYQFEQTWKSVFQRYVLSDIDALYKDKEFGIWILQDNNVHKYIKNDCINIRYGSSMSESRLINAKITTVTSTYSPFNGREYYYGWGWSPGYDCNYLSVENVI